MTIRLYIHATNISQGGGKTLLSSLLNELPQDVEIVAQIDSRMLPGNIPKNLSIRSVAPSILQRLLAELWLFRNVVCNDIVLCMGSLPPLLKLQGHTSVFIQNRYLIDSCKLSGFPLKTRLRLIYERMWLWLVASNSDEYIVQTPTMKSILQRSGYLKEQPVHVRPFISELLGYQRTHQPENLEVKPSFDFIYVASGEPHKNHRVLINAWCLMAEQNLYPSLCLTLDKDASTDLCRWIDKQKDKYLLKVTNARQLSHSQVLQLYSQAGALIYPSSLESFGLPLIEASQLGLPVLAAELDYVRDVLDPAQSFDPDSPVSIARAVKRFMNVSEDSLPLLDAPQFLSSILKRSAQ